MEVDCFEDIFCDPALLEGEENTDGDFEELQQKSASTEPNKSTESQLQASTSKRSKCQLNKKEREHVIQSLEVISGETLLDIVVNDLSTKMHMHHYQEREELMISLVDSSGEELKTICTGLAKSFIELYAKCDKGKEKYGRFQVEWHQSCSKFLLPIVEQKHVRLSDSPAPEQLWLAITSSFSRKVCNPVMIAMASAVYGYMLQQARLLVKDDEECSTSIRSEPDEVYLRFGGGALASMFTGRYKDMKSNKSSQHKEKVSQELQVLGWIRMVDKSELPIALEYRDRGGMYFPDKALLPFIKSLDECVRESTNTVAFQRYGKNLVRVVTDQVQQNQLLFKQFKAIINARVEDAQLADDAILSVYSEFSRKLCNTRINEYLDTYRQTMAADKGKATLAGQNLRDTLLSQHVNLKSKSN